MPFTHVDIQRERKRRSTLLFFILVLYSLLGLMLLWVLTHPVLHLLIHRHPDTNAFFRLSVSEVGGMLLIAMAVAAGHWLSAVWGGVNRILFALQAQPPDPHDRYHQQLMNLIEEMRIAAGGPRVRTVVIPTLALNAFAIATRDDNGVIGVTEGLLARLNRSQLQAVLAHEMAHLLNKDSQLTTIACALFGVYAQLLRGMTTTNDEGVSPAALPIFWPALIALALLTVGARLLNMAISRHRESLADATAVRLTRNPLALAEALAKISNGWRGASVIDPTLEPIFIAKLDDRARPEQESWTAELFSTHPPMSKRLTALLQQAHTSLTALMTAVEQQEQSRRRPAPTATHHAPAITWWVWSSDRWQGPYAAEQMVTLDLLQPASWICRAQGTSVTRATDDPILLEAMARHAADQSFSSTKCPRCRQYLAERDYEGMSILHCHFCQGYLLRQPSIFRILARREVGFPNELRIKVKQLQQQMIPAATYRQTLWRQDPSQALRCTRCGHPMLRNFYTYEYRVVVDRCLNCDLLWFDRDELDLLQIMVEESSVGSR